MFNTIGDAQYRGRLQHSERCHENSGHILVQLRECSVHAEVRYHDRCWGEIIMSGVMSIIP